MISFTEIHKKDLNVPLRLWGEGSLSRPLHQISEDFCNVCDGLLLQMGRLHRLMGLPIHQIRQVEALCGGGSPRPPPLGLLDAPDGNAADSCLCPGQFWFAAQNILAAFAGTKSGESRGQVHFTDARLDL